MWMSLDMAITRPVASRASFVRWPGSNQPPPDGLRFDTDSARSLELQEDEEYSGVRVRITAYLGSAQIRTQVDVTFGDELVDDPIETELPALLDFPGPRLRTYSAEASIAEKLQAMVRFGSSNTRMKDYFDVYTLSRERSFEGPRLEDQISATFTNRDTPLPSSVPTGLTEKIGRQRAGDWRAFLDDADAERVPDDFSEVVAAVRKFVHPPLQSAAKGQTLGQRWHPDEGWT
ncbi:MAG: nucleotidyl transferase AbiEii/AbiGii toxin family protein [Gemmatimonadota bacterium]